MKGSYGLPLGRVVGGFEGLARRREGFGVRRVGGVWMKLLDRALCSCTRDSAWGVRGRGVVGWSRL